MINPSTINTFRFVPIKHIGSTNILMDEIFEKSSSVVVTNIEDKEIKGYYFDVDSSVPYRSKGIFQFLEADQFGYVKSNRQDEVIIFERSGFLKITAYVFDVPYIKTEEVFEAFLEGAFDKNCWDILDKF